MSTLTPESRSALIQLLRQKLSPTDAKDIADDWGYTIGLGAGLYEGLTGGGTHERIAALVDRAQQVDRAFELLATIERWRKDLRDVLTPLRPDLSATTPPSTPPTKVIGLQEYKDTILKWKSNQGLGDIGKRHPLRKTARELTLNTLLLLTRTEKGALLLFLNSEKLIWFADPIIDLSEADLSEADLRKADLSEANLSEADLRRANLVVADLSGANLHGANLHYANLGLADLSGVDLVVADLSGADLSSADLTEADLHYANLSGADLGEADLSGADLSGAQLSGADLSGADLKATVITDEQIKSARSYEGIKNRTVT